MTAPLSTEQILWALCGKSIKRVRMEEDRIWIYFRDGSKLDITAAGFLNVKYEKAG